VDGLPQVNQSMAKSRPLNSGFVFILICILGIVAVLAFAAYRLVGSIKERAAFHRSHPGSIQAGFGAAPARHQGPVAAISDLKGIGAIYLVQVGPHTTAYSLDDLAQWLRSKYALDVRVLPAISLDHAALDESRVGKSRGGQPQYAGELLYAQMKRAHPDLAADKDAYLFGMTEADMYSVYTNWQFSFTQRDGQRAAIISSHRMQDTPWERQGQSAETANQHYQDRLKRIVLRDIAILYWHLQLNNDPSSLLQLSLDPDIPAEDIYQSDLDPAHSSFGESVAEACVLFHYSSKENFKLFAGEPVQECSGADFSPDEDETRETFQVDLNLGLLVDRHTDFNLPDSTPIQFQRVLRNGWSGVHPFGLSGTDNYDDYLQSVDNITINLIHADGGRNNLVREPRWLPFLSLVKYVDTDYSGRFYEMRWHGSPFEHYEMRTFDGEVRSYLPCDSPSVYCYLIGYRSAQGQELKFYRDSDRRLVELITPNQSSIHLSYGAGGGISQISDGRGRIVRYGYDSGNRLTSVAYPSGEVYLYQYDQAQHLVAFSISPNATATPRLLLRNEYTNDKITRQIFADGGVWAYDYRTAPDGMIVAVNVRSATGRVFKIDIQGKNSILREQNSSPQAAQAHASSK